MHRGDFVVAPVAVVGGHNEFADFAGFVEFYAGDNAIFLGVAHGAVGFYTGSENEGDGSGWNVFYRVINIFVKSVDVGLGADD